MTPSQRLATVLLGQDVRDWLRTQRADGASWRIIARNLYNQTNHQVDVSHEAVRSWLEDDAA